MKSNIKRMWHTQLQETLITESMLATYKNKIWDNQNNTNLHEGRFLIVSYSICRVCAFSSCLIWSIIYASRWTEQLCFCWPKCYHVTFITVFKPSGRHPSFCKFYRLLYCCRTSLPDPWFYFAQGNSVTILWSIESLTASYN